MLDKSDAVSSVTQVRYSVTCNDAEQASVEWTKAEEAKVVRKLDLIIMPLLISGFFVMQLDRGNIGNALTDFFLADVGITQFQFNVGQQLLSLGIVLFEIPSNLVLYRVGPQKWISCQILCWGLVATLQALQKGVAAYYATRLLLGILEAGFIPAGLYIITQWYRRNETSRRFSAFYLGNMVASAASGLIAYGILHMRGIAGLGGWQWLFLIEGLFTILVGVVFAALMPHSPGRPANIFGYTYFTEREILILTNRTAIEDPDEKRVKHKYVQLSEVWNAFSRWYIYPQLLVSFCCIAVIAPLGSYSPSIIASYGYDRLQANALSSVGGWIVIVLNLLFGWAADKSQRRGFLVLVGVTLAFVFCLATQQLTGHSNKDLKYGILTCATLWGVIVHPLNGSWIAVNIPSPAERSIIMALFVMSANAAGIAGAQIFQASDAPRYFTGFTVILSLSAVALVFGIVSNLQYIWLNRKLSIHQPRESGSSAHAQDWRFSL